MAKIINDWKNTAPNTLKIDWAAIFTDPYSPLKVIDGLAEYMDKNGIKSLLEVVGQCQEW